MLLQGMEGGWVVIEASHTVRSGLNVTCHMLIGHYNNYSGAYIAGTQNYTGAYIIMASLQAQQPACVAKQLCKQITSFKNSEYSCLSMFSL